MPFQTEHLNYVVAMIIRLDVFMYFHPVVWIGWLDLAGREFFFRFSLSLRATSFTHIFNSKQNDFRDLCIAYIDTNYCLYISIVGFACYCGYRRSSHHGVHRYYILVRSFFWFSLSLCNPHYICVHKTGWPHVKTRVYFRDTITFRGMQRKNGCILDNPNPIDLLVFGIAPNVKYKSRTSIIFVLGQVRRLVQTIFHALKCSLQVFVC